jgi:hypothetical protein
MGNRPVPGMQLSSAAKASIAHVVLDIQFGPAASTYDVPFICWPTNPAYPGIYLGVQRLYRYIDVTLMFCPDLPKPSINIMLARLQLHAVRHQVPF